MDITMLRQCFQILIPKMSKEILKLHSVIKIKKER